MPRGDAPDYWLRGQVIELIKLVEEINLIKQINLIDVIDRINLIRTIEHALTRTELIKNPSFETGDLTGWYIQAQPVDVVKLGFEGDYSCELGVGAAVNQVSPGVLGAGLKVNFTAKAEIAGDMIGAYVVFIDDTSEVASFNLTVDWRFYTAEFTIAKPVRYLYFGTPVTNAGKVWFDAVATSFTSLTWHVKDVVENSGSIIAAENTAGLQVNLNNDYRQLVQFRATLGAAGEVRLEASHNGTDWFTLWTKTLDEAGSYCDWDLCGFPYFRVNVPTTGIDINIDIRAVRL